MTLIYLLVQGAGAQEPDCTSYVMPIQWAMAAADASAGILDGAAFQPAIAQAVAAWSDPNVAVGTALTFQYLGVQPYDPATAATDSRVDFGVLTDTKWVSEFSTAGTAVTEFHIDEQLDDADPTNDHHCILTSTVWFREATGGASWEDDLPSALPPPVMIQLPNGPVPVFAMRSRPITALHELAHVLGQVDGQAQGSLLNQYPHLGDAADGRLRLTHDALHWSQQFAPGVTSGINLTLFRFDGFHGVRANLVTKEGWTNDFRNTDDPENNWPAGVTERWEERMSDGYGSESHQACRPPTPFYASAGSGTVNVTADIVLGLTADPTGADCPAIQLWRGQFTLGGTSHEPTRRIRTSRLAHDDLQIPADITPMRYWLCAKIDPDDVIDETYEDDNVIVSNVGTPPFPTGNRKFEVLSATLPEGCP